ncbi:MULTISPECIES: hypothetical protein [Bacillaceae]|uniref:YtxH domain-containing protein n=1 Tax=Evansella alkalicola TaxID=745819 RepID=A0ABS6JU24_9BACI|nr:MULTISPECIES: hypothetical protein [Bacillaceae]MBU9722075.1 hypothetical protein [Bacillus alkalicola]
MDMFKRKRNNKNGLMMSLVGVGIGAAAVGMMRGKRNGGNQMMQPIQKAIDKMQDQYS